MTKTFVGPDVAHSIEDGFVNEQVEGGRVGFVASMSRFAYDHRTGAEMDSISCLDQDESMM
jgi:hypothetical protein